MNRRTKIEWVKNPDGSQGYTWNPITGCLNHINGMCKGGNFPCYAFKLANGRLRERYLANKNIAPVLDNRNLATSPYQEEAADIAYGYRLEQAHADPFYPRFWEDRIHKPILIKKPIGIFTVDMGELFGDWVPALWKKSVFDVIKSCPQHRFYLLTKQPQHLAKWSPFPSNVWLGVSVPNRSEGTRATLHMKGIRAKLKFASFEPLLEKMDGWILGNLIKGLDWLIIGAQTKPTVYPKIEWIKEIVEAADRAGVPVFLKDNLHPVLSKQTATRFHRAYPDYCELRQEIPR